jgi:hypothetical protein
MDGILIFESSYIHKVASNQNESQRQLYAKDDHSEVKVKFLNEKVWYLVGCDVD